jgi:hypothetical protein
MRMLQNIQAIHGEEAAFYLKLVQRAFLPLTSSATVFARTMFTSNLLSQKQLDEVNVMGVEELMSQLSWAKGRGLVEARKLNSGVMTV